jgi:hypothetical protein
LKEREKKNGEEGRGRSRRLKAQGRRGKERGTGERRMNAWVKEFEIAVNSCLKRPLCNNRLEAYMLHG